jgi:hypothetical protein
MSTKGDSWGGKVDEYEVCKERMNSGFPCCGESRQQKLPSLQQQQQKPITRRQRDVKLTQKFLTETEKNNQFLKLCVKEVYLANMSQLQIVLAQQTEIKRH